jgi:hypothetical protein
MSVMPCDWSGNVLLKMHTSEPCFHWPCVHNQSLDWDNNGVNVRLLHEQVNIDRKSLLEIECPYPVSELEAFAVDQPFLILCTIPQLQTTLLIHPSCRVIFENIVYFDFFLYHSISDNNSNAENANKDRNNYIVCAQKIISF